MPRFHAIVWLDHTEAHVLQFDAESVAAERIRARSHHPRHHGKDERALAHYFDEIAQALNGVHEVLLVGPGHAREELQAWATKHAAAVAKAVVGNQAADHPSDAQLVALARQFFVRHDRMAGTPTPL